MVPEIPLLKPMWALPGL